MPVNLLKHQKLAVGQLKTGSVLCGGVGSGKSITSIFYYKEKEWPKDLFIITTPMKRDSLDWELECAQFALSRDRSASIGGVKVTVDSWNNIKKYIKVKNAFFIFDEQRVIGSGNWVRSFLKIVKNNNWILLSATPGDTWVDYIPVFIANGFYKNRSEFLRTHVVYNNWTKYPKIDHYIEKGKLLRHKKEILVVMPYDKKTTPHSITITVNFDKDKVDLVKNKRWNPYTNKPIKDISEYCHVLRKIVNSDSSRIQSIKELLARHKKIIIFYNFNYELELLKQFTSTSEFGVAEHNGHKHEPIPKTESWIYLVQYISGSEGWNCIETNTIIFYSQNYSYRMMTQAAGRIDRLNSPFKDLYYYNLRSGSIIDEAIYKALKVKRNFNEIKFVSM